MVGSSLLYKGPARLFTVAHALTNASGKTDCIGGNY